MAAQTFRETLLELRGTEGLSEVAFRNTWLGKLREDERLYADGWYVPPPHGMAVLFSNETAPDRISFGSLRDEASWPSRNAMDWSEGCVYAYASPVDKVAGLAGDFAVTLYFGTDPGLREHFRNCYSATREVLDSVSPGLEARELFQESERIFARHGLQNAVVSSTDSVPLDLGHTLPALKPDATGHDALTPASREYLSQARQFISSSHSWQLATGDQVTIEPQLVSTEDPSLPQISFHYVAVLGQVISILDECDELFHMLELTP